MKEKLAAQQSVAEPALQKLLFSGRVLADTVNLGEANIKQGDFLVLMVAKPKPPSGACATEAVPLVPTEAQLREHIVSELQAFSEGTLRQAIDRASAHFSVDVRASGLKPLIKQLLGELL